MKHANTQEIDMRINSFLSKKSEKYPELMLRTELSDSMRDEYGVMKKISRSLGFDRLQLFVNGVHK